MKAVFLLLLLIGAGSAAAFHYLKKPSPPGPVANYEKPDEAQAVAKVAKAKTQQELDQETLEVAKAEMNAAQMAWESAKFAKEQAEVQPEGKDLQKLQEAFAEAESKRKEAKTQLKMAEDKLKTADELLAEAQAERERVEKQLAQEAAFTKALLGKWKRSDYYGGSTLELKEEGIALMVIDFNTLTSFAVGADRLEIDIAWKIANGDHVIFDSVGGRPAKAFAFVTKEKGNQRDQILTDVTENSFTTHDADNTSKVKIWTRIQSE